MSFDVARFFLTEFQLVYIYIYIYIYISTKMFKSYEMIFPLKKKKHHFYKAAHRVIEDFQAHL